MRSGWDVQRVGSWQGVPLPQTRFVQGSPNPAGLGLKMWRKGGSFGSNPYLCFCGIYMSVASATASATRLRFPATASAATHASAAT
jgi:hypothetical protein